MPSSEGYSYCLTMIDRYTNWVEVVPLRNIEAETVARKFYSEWIARFGTPRRIHCDQGRQFESRLFHSLARLCGIDIKRTTAYHPQANGKIERFHRTLKAAIRANGNSKWTEALPSILLGLRSTIKLDSQASIAEMVYGMTLRLPGDFLQDEREIRDEEDFVRQLREKMRSLKPVNQKHKNRQTTFVHKDLSDADHVFVRVDRLRGALENPYEGPFQVLERTPKFFKINMKGAHTNGCRD
ncbi:hypothetical protein GE061_012382 [Apolygus lucorum]|uniref:Integrase catalytic domain-containing protein n=1 Tax=Apolygus lucorum TaxID=248454 RepID=A0A8S9XUV3_APOLU|nr:hypothetical protein GE061_012382 [Apolygus lucorum]